MEFRKIAVCRIIERKRYITEREKLMMIIVIFIAALIVFDLIALRWGHDSRDGFTSCEWIHKQSWPYQNDEQGEYC